MFGITFKPDPEGPFSVPVRPTHPPRGPSSRSPPAVHHLPRRNRLSSAPPRLRIEAEERSPRSSGLALVQTVDRSPRISETALVQITERSPQSRSHRNSIYSTSKRSPRLGNSPRIVQERSPRDSSLGLGLEIPPPEPFLEIPAAERATIPPAQPYPVFIRDNGERNSPRIYNDAASSVSGSSSASSEYGPAIITIGEADRRRRRERKYREDSKNTHRAEVRAPRSKAGSSQGSSRHSHSRHHSPSHSQSKSHHHSHSRKRSEGYRGETHLSPRQVPPPVPSAPASPRPRQREAPEMERTVSGRRVTVTTTTTTVREEQPAARSTSRGQSRRPEQTQDQPRRREQSRSRSRSARRSIVENEKKEVKMLEDGSRQREQQMIEERIIYGDGGRKKTEYVYR